MLKKKNKKARYYLCLYLKKESLHWAWCASATGHVGLAVVTSGEAQGFPGVEESEAQVSVLKTVLAENPWPECSGQTLLVLDHDSVTTEQLTCDQNSMCDPIGLEAQLKVAMEAKVGCLAETMWLDYQIKESKAPHEVDVFAVPRKLSAESEGLLFEAGFALQAVDLDKECIWAGALVRRRQHGAA